MYVKILGAPVGPFAFFVGLLASMGGFLFGWDTGQISALTEMDDFKNRFVGGPDENWNTWIKGVVVGLLSVGAIFGALFGSPLGDLVGRRIAIVIGCIIFTIGIVIQVSAVESWVQVAIGRLVTGYSIGSLSAAVPVYQSETVPRQVRGSLVGTYQLFVTLGILLSYVTCYGTHNYTDGNNNMSSSQWRVPIGIGFAWGIILGIGIMFCPESPRWLARRGRTEQVPRILASMRGVSVDHPEVTSEYMNIMDEVAAEKELGSAGWLDCFKFEEKALYRTILGLSLQIGQQFAGVNYFFYFGVNVFQSVTDMDSYIIQIILGAVNTGTTFFGLWALDRFGRRACLLVGAIWMTIWLIIYASVGTAYQVIEDGNTKVSSHSAGILMICCACFFITGFATTWGPGVWSALAEFANPKLRGKQYGMATMGNWIANFCIGFFTPKIDESIHFSYGYVFAGCCFLNTLIVFFFMYESANLTLEDVNTMYLDPSVHAWNSYKWSPPGMSPRTAALPSQTDECIDEGYYPPELTEKKDNAHEQNTRDAEI